MGKGEGGIKYIIILLFYLLASQIDGKVVGGVISKNHSLCKEMEFDFAILIKRRGCPSRETRRSGQDVGEVS